MNSSEGSHWTMPIERREITLSADELQDAVISYMRVSKDEFPVGRLVSIDAVDADGAQGLAIRINPRNCGSQEITIHLEAARMVDTLIRFCVENNIPVPRDGRKRARFSAGSASLLILLDRNAA